MTVLPTAGCAAVRECHVGVVFLLGDRGYKLKEPERTGFLDFSTPDRRLVACRRNSRSNRRLAPDVRLGISDVSAPCDGPLRYVARSTAGFHASADAGTDVTPSAPTARRRHRQPHQRAPG